MKNKFPKSRKICVNIFSTLVNSWTTVHWQKTRPKSMHHALMSQGHLCIILMVFVGFCITPNVSSDYNNLILMTKKQFWHIRSSPISVSTYLCPLRDVSRFAMLLLSVAYKGSIKCLWSMDVDQQVCSAAYSA